TMSQFTVFLADGADNDSGCSREVTIHLEDPLIGANTWQITTPNAWIGTGSGTYEVNRKGPIVELVCTSDTDPRGFRLALFMLSYPTDLKSAQGRGLYASPFAPGKKS